MSAFLPPFGLGSLMRMLGCIMLDVCHYFVEHGLMGADVNSKPRKPFLAYFFFLLLRVCVYMYIVYCVLCAES